MKTLKLAICYAFVATIMALTMMGGKANATGSVHHNNNQTTWQEQGQGQLQGQLQGQAQIAQGGRGGKGGQAASFSGATSISSGSGYGYGQGGSAQGGYGFAGASGGDSSATSGNSGAQSSQSITLNQNTPATDLSKGVGVAVAPAVYNSMITCMGGVSAGGGFAGGAFSIGTSIESDDCNVRQDALLVKDDPEVYKAVACQSPRIKEAYRLAGRPCLTEPAKLSARQAQLNSEAKMKILADRYAEQAFAPNPLTQKPLK